MKFILPSIFLVGALAPQTLHAALTVAWSEDFESYTTPGTSLDGEDTASGTGVFATTAGIVANGAGGATLTADTTRQQFAIVNDTAALAGQFSFDIAHTVVPDPTTSSSIFLQFTEGQRSTGSNGVNDFSYTLNAASISTTPVAFNIFFNVTGSDFTYTAPDSSTQVLATGTYDVWIDNTLGTDGSNSMNGDGGLPTAGVSAIYMQTFTAQDGNVYTFDNMSFSVIPEPSSALLAMLGGLFVFRRRR